MPSPYAKNLRCNPASLPSPHLVAAHASLWATSPLVFVVRHIFCGSPPTPAFRLWCPLRFQSSPLTHLWKGFLLCGNFSCFTTPCPGWVSIRKNFVSVFGFYILSYLLLKRLGCFSGCLVSSANIQKLFCGSCSTFKWSFGKFMGEKVVFLSYSAAIFTPLSTKYKLLKGPLILWVLLHFFLSDTRSR